MIRNILQLARPLAAGRSSQSLVGPAQEAREPLARIHSADSDLGHVSGAQVPADRQARDSKHINGGGRLFEEVFRRIPVGMAIIEPTSLRIVAANWALTRLLGLGEEHLLAQGFVQALADSDRQRLRQASPGGPWSASLIRNLSAWRLARRGGGEVRMEVAEESVSLQGVEHVLLYHPATAQKDEVLKELAAPDLGQGEYDAAENPFTFAALHDLKEPLLMIRGYVDLLKSAMEPATVPAREYLDAISKSQRQMQEIVLSLLDFYRFGSMAPAKEPLELQAVLDDALETVRLTMLDSGAQVSCGKLPTVLADRLQVRRLFVNLVGNALKFKAARPPRIHVEAVLDGVDWRVTVRDNGMGIRSSQLQRVFEPFHRIEGRPDVAGTGLGLSICKRIVAAHGGRIWIESSEGEGTSVHFTLPRTEVEST
jgi:signal transduction histidine kinase